MTQPQPARKTPPRHATLEVSDAEGETMARGAVTLFGKWELTDEQASVLLGGVPARVFERWRTGSTGHLSHDVKGRLSNLMGIHAALRQIFSETDKVYGWVREPSDAFGGATALDVMLGGELTDIIRIRRYLDSVRNG